MEWRSKGFNYYRRSLGPCKERFEKGNASNVLVELLRALCSRSPRLCDLGFLVPEVPSKS
jgi:hypothetical protein